MRANDGSPHGLWKSQLISGLLSSLTGEIFGWKQDLALNTGTDRCVLICYIQQKVDKKQKQFSSHHTHTLKHTHTRTHILIGSLFIYVLFFDSVDVVRRFKEPGGDILSSHTCCAIFQTMQLSN